MNIFIIQLLYFRSRYKFQKYFLNKKTKNLEQGYNFFVQAMIAIANKDNKTAVQANNKMKKLDYIFDIFLRN